MAVPSSDAFVVFQVDVLESIRRGHSVPVTELTTSREQRTQDAETIQDLISAIFPSSQRRGISIPSFQMYLNSNLITTFSNTQSALGKAATSIIERWYSDEQAGFPARMPVEEHEDRVLRWIASSGIIPPYAGRQGSWRPDYLFSATSEKAFQPVICEINARLPFNTWLLLGSASKPFDQLGLDKASLKTGHDGDAFQSAILSMFDASHPGHILMGSEWKGIDVHVLPNLFHGKTGQPMRVISPVQLRLTPDSSSPTGYHLSCTVVDPESGNEIEERVWQMALEIVQGELRDLDPDVMREIARVCINDFRTYFLLHDKRLLAIILEELNNLLTLGVLTADEAQLLREGIVPSYLPGSQGWRETIASPATKDSFVLKNGRGGIGMGHVFGSSVSEEEWISALEKACEVKQYLDGQAVSLQQKVTQHKFDILNAAGEDNGKMHVVGSWVALNGKFVGTAVMRIAEELCLPIREGGRGMGMFAVTDT
ncbi:hypothetical protein V8C42DRAFT_339008 [Trichoderma barbatum]